jgi:hypothetical protein
MNELEREFVRLSSKEETLLPTRFRTDVILLNDTVALPHAHESQGKSLRRRLCRVLAATDSHRPPPRVNRTVIHSWQRNSI